MALVQISNKHVSKILFNALIKERINQRDAASGSQANWQNPTPTERTERTEHVRSARSARSARGMLQRARSEPDACPGRGPTTLRGTPLRRSFPFPRARIIRGIPSFAQLYRVVKTRRPRKVEMSLC